MLRKLIIPLISQFIEWIIKYYMDNGVKQEIVDNENGTHTVTTKVMVDGKIIKKWDETAESRFLKEMKGDHKKDGKEFLNLNK